MVLLVFLFGLFIGVVTVSLFACRSYDRGYKDGQRKDALPSDIEEFLNLNK
jgi:hypothetical protein